MEVQRRGWLQPYFYQRSWPEHTGFTAPPNILCGVPSCPPPSSRWPSPAQNKALGQFSSRQKSERQKKGGEKLSEVLARPEGKGPFTTLQTSDLSLPFCASRWRKVGPGEVLCSPRENKALSSGHIWY